MIQLVIVLQDEQPNQPIEVHGPLSNKLLCLGMIEMAKRAILDAQVEMPRVVAATGVPPGRMLKS